MITDAAATAQRAVQLDLQPAAPLTPRRWPASRMNVVESTRFWGGEWIYSFPEMTFFEQFRNFQEIFDKKKQFAICMQIRRKLLIYINLTIF